MYAKRKTAERRSGLLERLILSPEQQQTANRLIKALHRALQVAKPEITGLDSAVPMAEGYLDPAEIHVIWIFDQRDHLSRALENGGGRLLYQLTATALRESCMQVEGIDVNVHFDTQEDCQQDSEGDWPSRLSFLHYPARHLESTRASGQTAMTLVREPTS